MHLYLYLKHFPPYGDDLHEGTRKAVHGLATGLVNSGATVTILCESVLDSVYESASGYTIRCFKNPKSNETDTIDKTACFTLAPGFDPFLRQHRSHQQESLFILNGIFHRSLASLSRLLRKYAIPYVVAPHDPYHPSIFKQNAHLKWPYWHLLEKHMLQRAAAVQVLDRRHGEWLRRLQIKTPVIETPNGFAPSSVLAESSLQWRSNDLVKLYFLGRFDIYNKGLDLLLEAFANLVQVANVELTLQGPDWANERQQLELQAAQLGISEKVTILASDYTRSASELIATYDVFCMPSRFEGFSLSILEALLAARPVLVTEIAGVAPHVSASQCGIVVQPTIDSIQLGLMTLLEKRSQWQDMGLRGRDYVLKHLDWGTIATTTLEQYRHVLSA